MNGCGDIGHHPYDNNATTTTTASSTSATTLNELTTLRSRPTSSRRNNDHSNYNNSTSVRAGLESILGFGDGVVSPRSLFIQLRDGEDKICEAHLRREQRHHFLAIVFTATVHAVVTVVLDLLSDSPWNERVPRIITIPSLAVLGVVLFLIQSFSSLSQRKKECIAVLVWLLLTCQIFYGSSTTLPHHVTSDGLPWVALLTFLTQVTLPLGAWLALGPSLLLVAAYTVIAAVRNRDEGTDLVFQLVANGSVVLASIGIGLTGNIYMDRKVKRSVMETKSVLSAKVKIEAAYKEKKTLLLSVLPRHVAEEMIQDVGELTDGQFRKIYMSRYENVRYDCPKVHHNM